MAHYIICYDIANRKRLGKVHRVAVKYAIFVQYSVYYFNGVKGALQKVLDEIEPIIDQSEDDVRAYHVAPLKEALFLGRQWLPDDIVIT